MLMMMLLVLLLLRLGPALGAQAGLPAWQCQHPLGLRSVTLMLPLKAKSSSV